MRAEVTDARVVILDDRPEVKQALEAINEVMWRSQLVAQSVSANVETLRMQRVFSEDPVPEMMRDISELARVFNDSLVSLKQSLPNSAGTIAEGQSTRQPRGLS